MFQAVVAVEVAGLKLVEVDLVLFREASHWRCANSFWGVRRGMTL